MRQTNVYFTHKVKKNMEKQLYTCQFCQKEFEPTRRKAQKFCTATCRSKNHHHKHKKVDNTSYAKISENDKNLEKNKSPIEEMSVAGVGNAAFGTLIADATTAIAKKAFIPIENYPATKKDIQELKDLINSRYFEVHNISLDLYGRRAYFDMSTNKIVYYSEQLKQFELPQFDL